MVVITSGCATFQPYMSALGGVVGGLAVLPSSLFVAHVLKVDDPVDAITVSPQCCPLASRQAHQEMPQRSQDSMLACMGCLHARAASMHDQQ